MTAKELFGVGVRLVGLFFAVSAIPAILQLDYIGAVPGIAGLVLMTRADLIARLCYPNDLREKALKEFRDS